VRARALTTGEIGDSLGCNVVGVRDLLITGILPIGEAEAFDLTFIANPKYRSLLPDCRAGAIIISPTDQTPPHIVRLETPVPYIVFRKSLGLLYPDLDRDFPEDSIDRASISSKAVIGVGGSIGAFVSIEAGARIGDRVTLCNGCYIGRNVEIGDDSIIGINAVLRHDVKVGRRVVVGDNSVIGFDGFGYSPEADGFHKIPQTGTVILEDDVEIGANCCIDRATIGSTRIGRGTKLDNLIQIAHGVHIGKNTVMAAQTGISGSTTIGDGVMIGGQVGMAGHIDIGDGMVIGAQAGVTKSVDIKGMVSGYPARPHIEGMRREASINKISDLIKRVKALEEAVKKVK